VITGPGDNTTAVEDRRDGHLRASHADREQVIGILKAAFVQGRLTEDELDARVDQFMRRGRTRSVGRQVIEVLSPRRRPYRR
jgi:hypothetical protein